MSQALYAIYLRVASELLEQLCDRPDRLGELDVREALLDGRAVDLGRRWEELGCLLDGGIEPPCQAPTVADVVFAAFDDDRTLWGYVSPARVRAMAHELSRITPDAFLAMYRVDDADTADAAPGDRTERIADPATYLYRRFEQLRDHYVAASERGEAVLVRLGERAWDDAAEGAARATT